MVLDLSQERCAFLYFGYKSLQCFNLSPWHHSFWIVDHRYHQIHSGRHTIRREQIEGLQ